MKKLFGTDSRLFRLMTMLMELACMNLLFIICSLPVVTIGASFSALYMCLYDMYKSGEGCFSAKLFFDKYRSTLKPATLIWCPCLLALLLVVYNFLFLFNTLSGVSKVVLSGIYIVLFILVIGFLQFSFFFLSRTSEWNKDYVKDAFILTIAKFPYVILTMTMMLSPLVILGLPGAWVLRILPLIILFWISCPGYICVSIFAKILKPLYPNLFSEEK